jgi:hypothetical protein
VQQDGNMFQDIQESGKDAAFKYGKHRSRNIKEKGQQKVPVHQEVNPFAIGHKEDKNSQYNNKCYQFIFLIHRRNAFGWLPFISLQEAALSYRQIEMSNSILICRREISYNLNFLSSWVVFLVN